jgi:uncharacterized protein involved in outer membrane biogenesis
VKPKSLSLKITIALLAAILLAAGVAYWLHNNVDRLIQQTIETQGSQMTGAPVRVGAVKISALDGRGELSNLVIGNPPGFKSLYALKVERVLVEIDIATLTKDVVTIKRIEVAAPDVIYEKGATATNFDVIQKNIATAVGSSTDKKGGKKIIVDHFSLRDANAKVSAAFMNGKTLGVSLPDITLNHIGQQKNGIPPDEFGQIVAGALKHKLTGAYSFERALSATGEVLGKAGNAVKDLFK